MKIGINLQEILADKSNYLAHISCKFLRNFDSNAFSK